MRKRAPSILALMLCLALLPGKGAAPASAAGGAGPEAGYGIYVGQQQVTEGNRGDVLGDGTVRYDPDRHVLTLNGLTLRDGSLYRTEGAWEDERRTTALYLPDTVTLELVDGSVNHLLIDGDRDRLSGVYAGGNLTLTGGGTLIVDTSGARSSGGYPMENVALYARGALTVLSGTLDVSGGMTGASGSGRSTGILCRGLEVSGGVVSACSSSGVGTSVAIRVEEEFGTTGRRGDLRISGGRITARAGQTVGTSVGISARAAVIAGGEVTACGDVADDRRASGSGNWTNSCGISADELTVTGGTLDVTAENAGSTLARSNSIGAVGHLFFRLEGGTVIARHGTAVAECWNESMENYRVIAAGLWSNEELTLGGPGAEVSVTGASDFTLDAATRQVDGALLSRAGQDPIIVRVGSGTAQTGHTVTFDANGGTAETEQAATDAAGLLAALPGATRPGWMFTGWYTRRIGGARVTGKTVFDGDAVLYARWLPVVAQSERPGSGASAAPSYGVQTGRTVNGSLVCTPGTAVPGTAVSVEPRPEAGHELESLTVVDRKGSAVPLTETEGRYTFTMPASPVTVAAVFRPAPADVQGDPFHDIYEGDPCYGPVLWAWRGGVIVGTDTGRFEPGRPVTRGQAIAFLWRAKGSPEPTMKSSPFLDVSRSDECFQAALWGYESGVTAGVGGGRFDPNGTLTRAQAVTLLCHLAGRPAQGEPAFRDVPDGAWYAGAARWAWQSGLLDRSDAAVFDPDGPCLRGQIMIFLYRCLAG